MQEVTLLVSFCTINAADSTVVGATLVEDVVPCLVSADLEIKLLVSVCTINAADSTVVGAPL